MTPDDLARLRATLDRTEHSARDIRLDAEDALRHQGEFLARALLAAHERLAAMERAARVLADALTAERQGRDDLSVSPSDYGRLRMATDDALAGLRAVLGPTAKEASDAD